MICKNCNAQIADDVAFCPECGFKIGSEGTAGPRTQPEVVPVYVNCQPQEKTNGMAIAGFVLSFFVSLLGLIFSAVALKQIKETKEGGHGLAVAGLVISIVSIAIGIIVACTTACTTSYLIRM